MTSTPESSLAKAQPHQITLQKGMKKFKGFMFVGDSALYFICTSKGSALWDAVGTNLGLVGGIIKGVGEGLTDKKTGANVEKITDSDLAEAAAKAPDSIVFEPGKIELITNTLWTRMIRWNGQKFGVPTGYPKALKKELGPWIQRHGVKAKGWK